jgi:hypothetical protein
MKILKLELNKRKYVPNKESMEKKEAGIKP